MCCQCLLHISPYYFFKQNNPTLIFNSLSSNSRRNNKLDVTFTNAQGLSKEDYTRCLTFEISRMAALIFLSSIESSALNLGFSLCSCILFSSATNQIANQSYSCHSDFLFSHSFHRTAWSSQEFLGSLCTDPYSALYRSLIVLAQVECLCFRHRKDAFRGLLAGN